MTDAHIIADRKAGIPADQETAGMLAADAVVVFPVIQVKTIPGCEMTVETEFEQGPSVASEIPADPHALGTEIKTGIPGRKSRI
jgi:hypothetical protein